MCLQTDAIPGKACSGRFHTCTWGHSNLLCPMVSLFKIFILYIQAFVHKNPALMWGRLSRALRIWDWECLYHSGKKHRTQAVYYVVLGRESTHFDQKVGRWFQLTFVRFQRFVARKDWNIFWEREERAEIWVGTRLYFTSWYNLVG